MAAAKRKSNYKNYDNDFDSLINSMNSLDYFDFNHIKELPAKGNPHTFKQFVVKFKNNEYSLLTELEDEYNVLSFFKDIENRNATKKGGEYKSCILDWDSYQLHLYFKYLYIHKTNHQDSIIKTHGRWLGENLSYEELYQIKKACSFITINVDKIVYKDGNNELQITLFN